MVVKKLFEANFDDEVHSNFLKFGRGEYKNKFIVEAKKQKDNWSIKTSSEFVNALVRRCLNNAGDKVNVTGVIVATTDLRSTLPFPIKKVGNFQGVRKHEIAAEIETKQLLQAMDKYPRAFFALSFKTSTLEIKVKAKAPTSGKPGKESDEGPKADFCSIKTTDLELLKELFFDGISFKEATLNHTLKIDNIVYPANMESLKPEQIREQSKRQGIIFRTAVLDGKETKTQAKFTA